MATQLVPGLLVDNPDRALKLCDHRAMVGDLEVCGVVIGLAEIAAFPEHAIAPGRCSCFFAGFGSVFGISKEKGWHVRSIVLIAAYVVLVSRWKCDRTL